jgi:hypothetical protein
LGLNIFMSASMNQLWVFMNSLQLIVALPLSNVSFPPNAQLLSSVLNTIASFDMIPMTSISNNVFKIGNKNTNVKHNRFADYIFDTNDFILNGGLMIWSFFFYLGLAISTLVFMNFKRIKNKFYWKIINLLTKLCFFSFLIRFLLEGYIEFLLISIMNFYSMNWDNYGNSFSAFLSVFFLVTLGLMPVTLYFFTTYVHKVIQ